VSSCSTILISPSALVGLMDRCAVCGGNRVVVIFVCLASHRTSRRLPTPSVSNRGIRGRLRSSDVCPPGPSSPQLTAVLIKFPLLLLLLLLFLWHRRSNEWHCNSKPHHKPPGNKGIFWRLRLPDWAVLLSPLERAGLRPQATSVLALRTELTPTQKALSCSLVLLAVIR